MNLQTHGRTEGRREGQSLLKSCVSATKYEQGFYPDEATSSFLLPAPIETMQQIRNYGIVSERKFDQGWIHNYFVCAMDEQGQREKTPANQLCNEPTVVGLCSNTPLKPTQAEQKSVYNG